MFSKPNGKPGQGMRIASVKVGYFKAKQLDYRSKAERLEIAATKAAKVELCSECGKPALRRFYTPKKGHYGRCKAHMGGAVVPFSYCKVS